MSNVPTNLIPTRITQLPDYTGTSTLGYVAYSLEGRTYKVQFSQIAAVGAVPSTRVIATGNGLQGGGDLSADRTISIIPYGIGSGQLALTGVVAGTYGGANTIPAITVDDTGRITSAADTPIVLTDYVPNSRTVSAGSGLAGGGQLNSNITLSISFSNATPQSLGAASAGTGTQAARDDHVHPPVNLTATSETQGVLPLGRGGTGNALSPVVGAVIYAGADKLYQTIAGNAGQILTSAGGLSAPYWTDAGSGTGTVTSVSVVSANGLAGTVANATTTPAITISTSVSGLLKGNGTAISAASAGADYVAPGAYTTSGLTMATSSLLGRTTASVGAAEELTVGSGLLLSGGSLSNSAPDQTVVLNAGTGLSVSGTYPSFNLANTAPDQVVTLTAGTNVTITGTYPSFTIAATGGSGSGTVTSVSGTGTVNGITLTGTVTSSGSLTLGGTLSGVSLTTQVSGTLPIANGGTNGTATPTAGGVAYGTGTAYAVNAAGPAGYVLTSGGAAPPVWTPVASLATSSQAYWGSFWDTTTQTAPLPNTAYMLTLNSADPTNNGVSVVSGSRVTFTHAGVYSLTFSVQFENTDTSNAAHEVNIWLRKNDSGSTGDVPDSDSRFTVPAKHAGVSGSLIGTVNFVLTLAAGDFVELVYSVSDVHVTVASVPAGTAPVSPRIPSIIFTAVAAAPVGLGYAGVVSATSTTIGTGSKTFTVNTDAADSAFIVGNRVRVIYNSTNYMDGVITAYSGTSMTVLVDGTAGSGTYTAWTVSLTGSVGGVTSFSGNSTGLTPSTPTSGAIVLAGTLNAANGGTGQTSYTDGQLLIGNTTGNTLTKATLTAGTNVSITNGSGAITINATDQYVGTVTSVGGTGTVNGITLTGTVTSSGSLTLGGTLSGVSLTTQVSGTLPVGNGGTGATTLTGLVVGNGASAMTAVTAPSGAVVGTTDTQTLSGKTITGTKETVFTITDGASVDIDPANGGIQTWTLGASRTPTATNFAAGQSVTLMVDDGTAYTITWTTIAVTWLDSASAPTLQTTGYTIIELFKIGSVVYGLARR
jgi:hypothetical protein